MEQHLLAIPRRDDHDLGWGLADCGHRTFALADGHAAKRITEFDHALKYDQRRLAVCANGQRPVGSPHSGGRCRGVDSKPLTAAFGASPNRTGLKLQLRVACGCHLLDAQRCVSSEPYLGSVGKKNGKRTGCVGAQYVAGKKILSEIDKTPVGNVDEAYFLAGSARDDGACDGGRARNGLSQYVA